MGTVIDAKQVFAAKTAYDAARKRKLKGKRKSWQYDDEISVQRMRQAVQIEVGKARSQ